MHDLHVADQVFRLVLAEAKKNQVKKIAQIYIELGSVLEHGATIAPENLKFNIEMLSQGTLAQGAKVIIDNMDGSSWKLVSISGE